MFMTFIHSLIEPIATWHSNYKALIVAEWLEKYDTGMATVVWMFRESRKKQMSSAPARLKKSTRRRALRKLRTVCSDPAVRRAVQKKFPPLPQTYR